MREGRVMAKGWRVSGFGRRWAIDVTVRCTEGGRGVCDETYEYGGALHLESINGALHLKHKRCDAAGKCDSPKTTHGDTGTLFAHRNRIVVFLAP